MRSSRFFSPSAASAAALVAAVALSACGGASKQSTVTVVKTVTVETHTAPAPTVTQSSNKTGSTGTVVSQSGTATTKPIGAACTASVLTPSYLGTNGAAGTIELGFSLTNHGSSTCHTYGWPGVQLLSSTDASLPTDAIRTKSDLLGATPAVPLNLKPGAAASFRILESDSAAGGRSCPTATKLQIIAPDDTATMKVALAGGVPACGKTKLSPLMPGSSAYASQ